MLAMRKEFDALRQSMRRSEARATDAPSTHASGASPTLHTGVFGNERDTHSPAGESAGESMGPTAAEFAAVLTADLESGPFNRNAMRKLWGWTVKNQKNITSLQAELKKAIAENPSSAELQAALATTYASQLSSGELNREDRDAARKGAWGAYDKAIELDPNHWQARWGKAFGTTFIPPQFGGRISAIKQFEELKKIQETGAPQPEQSGVYSQLGRLYVDAGRSDKARTALENGLERFPDDERIKEQLRLLSPPPPKDE